MYASQVDNSRSRMGQSSCAPECVHPLRDFPSGHLRQQGWQPRDDARDICAWQRLPQREQIRSHLVLVRQQLEQQVGLDALQLDCETGQESSQLLQLAVDLHESSWR
jgi:hypothetical protein